MSAQALDLNTQADAVQRRMWRYIAALIVIGVVAGSLTRDFRFVAGFAIGGGLALFNFWWLVTSVRAILATGSESVSSWTSAAKFVFRWIVIGAVACGAYLTGIAKPIGILTGLLAPGVAVMIEAGYLLYLNFSQDEA
ncbi:MAG TPA: ATP synthase subunit I [Blastocatellia bacterium]|nr:ATP synthase subunit I [Blastocatellia bacterium]